MVQIIGFTASPGFRTVTAQKLLLLSCGGYEAWLWYVNFRA